MEPIKPSKLVAARSVSCNQEANDIAFCTKVRNFFLLGGGNFYLRLRFFGVFQKRIVVAH